MALDVLLSGFAPFGGDATNPSWSAAQHAAKLLVEEGIRAEAKELPVEFGVAAQELLRLVEAEKPRVVIAAGLAAGRKAVTPERIGINLRDARIPDNAGAQPLDEKIVADGPDAHFSTLPCKVIVAALGRADIPASVSYHAGTYVCNDLLYLLVHGVGEDCRAGFVHVPAEADLDPLVSGQALAIAAREALAVGDGVVDARLRGGSEA
ncbi:pyroglutamyl-peptidase I family protein [Dermabacteraceae bacterium P13136]